HGAAGIIVLQILGWISFFALYLAFRHFDVDPSALCRQYHLTFFAYVFDKGGITLLAYLANRALAPIRYQIAKAVLPSVAAPINRLVQPIVDLFKSKKQTEESGA
ncbi:hypothetical protein BDR26DRAFT_788339, partial [Obelidium mucronatum]